MKQTDNERLMKVKPFKVEMTAGEFESLSNTLTV